jgi:tetratricopeptide (TPR) repeat protein
MDTNPNNETQPVNVSPKKAKKAKKQRKGRGLFIFLGILVVLIITGVGIWFGYGEGVRIRLLQAEKMEVMQATTQFQLAVVDLQEGRLDAARKRLEYVLLIHPEFPGLTEKLAELEVAKAMLATPTPLIEVTPTPTLVPTQDFQNQEQGLAQAKQYIQNKNWQAAIDTLNALRSEDINYHAIEVDGMYYLAYIGRGKYKLLNEGNLEGGIYDFSLAEQYGPLDRESTAYKQGASYYLTGSGFWQVDWPQAVYYFQLAYASMPNIRDGSNYTAAQRYYESVVGYAKQLQTEEKYCEADEQFKLAATLGSSDSFAADAAAVHLVCYPPTSTPAPTTAATAAPEATETTEEPPAAEPTATETVP